MSAFVIGVRSVNPINSCIGYVGALIGAKKHRRVSLYNRGKMEVRYQASGGDFANA